MKKPSYVELEDCVKEFEEALKESREQIKLIAEGAELGIWYQNFKTGEIVRNRQWSKMLGYRQNEIGNSINCWKKLIHPDDLRHAEKVAEDHQKGKTQKFKVEHRMKTKSGDWKWILNWGKIIRRDKNGKPVKAAGIHLDITDLKNAEIALKESEEKFKNLAEQSPNMIFINKKGKVVYVNDRCAEVTGYKKEDFYTSDFSFLNLIAPESVKTIKSNFKRHLKGIEISPVEYSLIGKKGNRIEVILMTKLIKYAGDYAILGTLTDITERKKADRINNALFNISKSVYSAKDLEELYPSIHNALSKIIDSTNFYIAIFDEQADKVTFTYWTDEKDDFPEIQGIRKSGSLTAKVINTEKPLIIKRAEILKKIKDKELKQWGTIPEIWLGVPLKIKEGVIGVLAVQSYTNPDAYVKSDLDLLMFVSDHIANAIQRKKAEDELKRSEALLNETQKISKIGGWEFDVETEKGKWTNEVYSIHGLSKGEGKAPHEKSFNCFHPEDKPKIKQAFNRLIEKGDPYDFELKFKSAKGKNLWVRTTAKPVMKGKKVIKVIGNIMDVTERKQIENELRFTKFSVDRSGDTAYWTDSDGKFKYINDQACKTLGYSREELLTMNVRDIDPEFSEKVWHEHWKEIKRRKTFTLEANHKRKDGTVFPVEIKVNYLNFEEKEYNFAFVRDITERKKTETTLKDSEKKYRELFNNIADPIFIFDKESQLFIDCNKSAIDKYGYTLEEIRKMTPLDLHPSDELEAVKQRVNGFRRVDPHFFTHITKEGKKYYVEIHSRDLIYKNRKSCISIVRDITTRVKAEEDKKKLEEQLYHIQKMESIGRLAGGIAHDFNNILTSIMGFAELLKMKFPDPSYSEGQAADIIIKSTERAADLTKQLLGFARGGKYQPVILNINEVITEVLTVSEKIFEKKIDVTYEYEKNISNIEADKNQLNQVFTNIIINARDAMPSGGELILKTQNINIDKDYLEIHPEFKVGKYIKVTISDTGIGMPREVRERVFEPFFSTKGAGKGSGLGLATVYGIIKNHNGYIYADSEPGKGSSFVIYLPATTKKISKIKSKDPDIYKGTGTILVVDDEKEVRDLLKNQFEELGYSVIIAGDGKEAVEKYEIEYKNIDLIILDMIMPKLDGKETFRKMKKINPDLKVLLISGFSQNDKATDLLNEGVLAFAQKPFKIDEISKIIQSILNK